ncbi:MAG: hypothetical protein IVW36_05495 [Dehalococcoidia bacterium]|nr:hypothetical protein [Dehalococcoidia bacterium]
MIVLLYREWFPTQPWDTLLAIGIIIIVAGVPTALGIGGMILKQRSDASRRLPWLASRAREAERRRRAEEASRR